MRLEKIILLLPTAAVCLLASCYTDKAELLYPSGSCDTSAVTYSAVVKPIIVQNCATSGCHDAATAASGISLDAYTGTKDIALDGRLVGSITHASSYSPMPKNASKLDDCSISKISIWVAAGAQNN